MDLGTIPADDPEVKRHLIVKMVIKELTIATDHLICYFSSWMKLKTSAAWFLKVEETLMLSGQKRKEFCASAGLRKDNPQIQE